MEKKLLGVLEAAKLLSLGKNATYALVASGELESIRVGGRRKVPTDALDRFIEARREQAAAEGVSG